MNMLLFGIAIGLALGSVAVLAVNAGWHRIAQQQNREWSEFCQDQNITWANTALEMIGSPKRLLTRHESSSAGATDA